MSTNAYIYIIFTMQTGMQTEKEIRITRKKNTSRARNTFRFSVILLFSFAAALTTMA